MNWLPFNTAHDLQSDSAPLPYLIHPAAETRTGRMGAARRWNARILPASFVVDAQGSVRYSMVGEADWTAPEIVAAIENLLPRQDP